MPLDKITSETVTTIGGTGGILGIIFYWMSVRWRILHLRSDVDEIKLSTRKIETCNQMNKNLCHSLANIEQTQREMSSDIKQLLLRIGGIKSNEY